MNALDTTMLPAIATPRDDPRLDTARESPEISPWSASGNDDWTMFTDAVSITPIPSPISSRPGMKVAKLEVGEAKSTSRTMPTIVATNPAWTSNA